MYKEKRKGHENLLTVTEAANIYKISFKKEKINLLLGYPGSGKTTFIMDDFINNTYKYTGQNRILDFRNQLSKVIYVCDTLMLRDSILHEFDDITNKLEKGGLKEAKLYDKFKRIIDDEDSGTIKVVSYQKFGMLIKNDDCRKYIEKNFECIILDEFHNLFNYYNKYESVYLLATITKLNELANNLLLIALTASPQPVYNYQFHNENSLNIREVFTKSELIKLDRHYQSCIKYYHNGWNMIKDVKWELIKGKYKALIYTDFISTEKLYAEFLTNLGLKVCWLCSPNAANKYLDVDENGNIKEFNEYIMTDEQNTVRNYLIETGEVPEEIDVLIVNASFETGWSLQDRNEKIQIVLVDSTKEDTHIQAIRVRHDIVILGLKWCRINDQGMLLHKNGTIKKEYFVEVNGRRLYYVDEDCNFDGKELYITIPEIEIPEEFLNRKLSKDDKKFLVDRFGIVEVGGRNATFKSLSSQLINQGYVIDTTNKGIYIYKNKEDYNNRSNKSKVEKRMNKLIDFLTKHEGGFIDENEIKKFIKIINLKKKDGTYQDKPKKINEYLSSVEIKFIILNKPSHGKKRWLIESYE